MYQIYCKSSGCVVPYDVEENCIQISEITEQQKKWFGIGGKHPQTEYCVLVDMMILSRHNTKAEAVAQVAQIVAKIRASNMTFIEVT